ncbi:hypothetical protein [Candidatus Profftia tarda]
MQRLYQDAAYYTVRKEMSHFVKTRCYPAWYGTRLRKTLTTSLW